MVKGRLRKYFLVPQLFLSKFQKLMNNKLSEITQTNNDIRLLPGILINKSCEYIVFKTRN